MSPASTSTGGTAPGTVSFVGMGPGDPELLTLRAAAKLGQADTVVVSRAACPAGLLSHCRQDVEVLEATEGDPVAQVATAARAGRNVVRLFRGDPGLACTMAEEAAACAEAGLPFEIVPGVSSVTGVPGYAGIPLTDARTREVRVIDASAGGVDWEDFSSPDATLVILGAEGMVAEVAKGLIAAGRPDSTPAAMTSLGTTTEQETVVSTLQRLVPDTKGMESPAMIIVGDVAGWRDRLSWFETKPLFGWRVLVPRTKEQAASLSERLRSYGAVPEEVPTISVEPPRTPQQMDRAVKGLVTGRYEWVVFTSTNAVRAIREKFDDYGLDARAFAGLKVAAVGEQTARALVEFGVAPDLVPTGQQSGEGLVEVWPPYDKDLDPINRVLLPRADIATDVLIAGLTELGWECDDVTAYRTVRAAPPPQPIREAIKGGGFDAVLFTSSSTVRNLIGIAGKPHNVTVIAVIGPQTAKTAQEYGLRVDVMADRPSALALAEALAEYGAKRRAAQIEAGDPLRKPSQMRRGARRRR
ncbi:uroporphyrinogen-III synthase /uroporphyrinogen-III C-methyltransferase [Thermomonospora echinospora]|uniref:Uroporphyrinogen-III synthase /uroporphyrinogen-III C-methyltransferase n=1 Tax=Thermomonospora echinospora TaxID=1992 RepID=A0A1H5YYS4_9ACTN|nr:bifunctional uroporphyrinogen-III C-methyltransferase/uroporphyrinogen-III synthase [Thermomonospora echinospora]SEG29373.1 uroporphyrinogen-III synthase /uroporphyrinogen-III C-methyltransferase [Thermomonospora echinospora]